MTAKLSVPQGEFFLTRYPRREKDLLRAWDAADEYLLDHLYHNFALGDETKALILNDSFGALAVPLAYCNPQSLSDSYLSQCATVQNLKRNSIDVSKVRLLSSLESPRRQIGALLFKIPKSLALLEDQLCRVRPHLDPDAKIIGVGMVRDIHSSTLDLCKRIIGPTETSFARKRARLIYCQLDNVEFAGCSPYPSHYKLERTEWVLSNHANVFSRTRLDNATRLLLDYIPTVEEGSRIADLGCGNGVLGIVAAIRNPTAEVLFFDESFMALASAEENSARLIPDTVRSFIIANGLEGITECSMDLVLCNPPFHTNRAIDETVPWRFIKHAYKALRPGGQLCIVGQNSLRHELKLKRIFGGCRQLANNKKFSVLYAEK